ncbi:hypothetical protein AAF712_004493 [Marasmius tenuissimus]|uniref:F-box domain-containing protein n=1 Tax=Marasmius tenuissimus TaxID=585030 RepID=A0ABR3A366_9AGAR
MQICRLWRAIAAKTLSMWTHLDLSRPKMAQEVLKYSGSAPLCVIMSSAYCQQNLFLEMLEQPSRISSLHMSGISPNLITNLLAKATQPVPYLRSIEIRPEGVPIRLAGFIPVILPTNFLGEDAPRLVSLHTTGCSIPWGSRAFRNLTTLHVSNSTLPTYMSLEDIAVTLQAATKLMEHYTWGSRHPYTYGNFTFEDPFGFQLRDHQVDAGICQRLLNALGTLPYLKKLEIYAPSLSQDALIERFGGCPLLCAITAHGPSAEVIVTSLSSNLSATHQPVPYPAVSTIILQSVDFDMIPMSTLLVDMLQRRSEYGVPVKRVVLRCCENLKADKVEMLRKEVGSDVEINWDGIESPSDSDDYDGSSDA